MNRSPWFALIVCCSLSPLSLAAAPRKPASPRVAPTPVVPGPTSLLSKDVCDIMQERTKLASANYELADLHFDSASDQFLALSKSCDPDTKAVAAERFRATHVEMSKWWWQMGRHFAPFRWYHIHYPRFWYALGIATAIVLALVAALAFFVFYTLYFPQLPLVHRFKSWLAKSYPRLSQVWFGSGAPNPVIMTPGNLTDTTETNLFAAMLQGSSVDVRRHLERAEAGLQVRSVALLSLPFNTTESLIKSLPSIKGVDLSGFAKFVFYLIRYFGWRVESQVGFCPPNKSADGTVLLPARIVASATVACAWIVKGGPWSVDRRVDDQYDIDAVAFAIAVRIMGKNRAVENNIIDALRFSNEESFGLFMEGLRALQLYEDETSREFPRKSRLERWMQDGLDCFRKCVSQFPLDPLPHFYLGVALATRNQEIYVLRLQRITSACVAVGRYLAFLDFGRDPDPKLPQSERDFAMQGYYREFENAYPYRDLADHPWPLLEEASRMFQTLLATTGDEKLQRVALYNLAQVDARRGKEAFLQAGLNRLGPGTPPAPVVSPQPSPSSTAIAKADTKSSLEDSCLDLQYDCLRESLKVRLLILKNTDQATFDTAFKKFQNIGGRIEAGVSDLSFKADLTADFFTKEGYIYFDRSFCPTLTGPSFTAEQCLEHAAARFTSALELKEHWNPAQIYLGLVRRVQSGIAEAHAELIAHQKKQLESSLASQTAGLEGEIARIAEDDNRQVPGEEPSLKIDRIIKNSSKTQAHKLDLNKLRVDTAEKRRCLEQSLAESNRQKENFSADADELFAVLQGLPWPPLQPLSITATAKPELACVGQVSSTASREGA